VSTEKQYEEESGPTKPVRTDKKSNSALKSMSEEQKESGQNRDLRTHQPNKGGDRSSSYGKITNGKIVRGIRCQGRKHHTNEEARKGSNCASWDQTPDGGRRKDEARTRTQEVVNCP